MKKITKKQESHIHKAFAERGIVNGVYETDYGPLNVRIDVNRGDQVATVFTRFDDVEKAREVPGTKPNPYTGKWNFHVWAETANGLPDMVAGCFDKIGVRNRSVNQT